MNYCSECGKKLVVVGSKPWLTYLKCINNHKYELAHGDYIGGSSDKLFKVKSFPVDMKPLKK